MELGYGSDDHDFSKQSHNRSVIPRMPWQDIASVIYGTKACKPLTEHFLAYWKEARLGFMWSNEVEIVKPVSLKPRETFTDETHHGTNLTIPYKQMSDFTKLHSVQAIRSSSTASNGMKNEEDNSVIFENSIVKAYVDLIERAEKYRVVFLKCQI